MNEASASARELLGKDHPLIKMDEATTAVERQALVCTVFLLATMAAAYPDIARAASLAGTAAVVDLTLVALVALLRHQSHVHARNVIIERGPLHLRRVQLEITRLTDEHHRARLAQRLHRAVTDAEDWHSLFVASRPPVGILELLPYAQLAQAIVEHLNTDHPNVRGVALVDRLLSDGYSSPLYAGNGYRLGCELRQILFELRRSLNP